ncbi:cytochrome C oxidase subunit IV family protein [Chloroflexota bacterium]
MMDSKKKKAAYEKGLIVLVWLAVLTMGELWFALMGIPWWSILVIIALIKATLVVRDYMHIGRLFSGEEEH